MKINSSLLNSAPDKTAETVASDLEGTLSAGIAWEELRLEADRLGLRILEGSES
jgi:hypothetical protein